MTEPKRFSDPSSEVDPVLRSVVRYGSRLGPDSEQLQCLLRATVTDLVAQPSPRKSRNRGPRRVAIFVGFGLAAAIGGVAWARYAESLQSAPAAPTAVAAPSAASSAAASRRAALEPRVERAPSQPSGVSVAPSAAAAVAASTPPRPSASSAASTEHEPALLQQARAIIASNPARALTLTRDHEVRFADSALVEERQALRVEALFRLGRRDEASRALLAFEAQYPRSPYRRRLQALGQ